jgi:DNA-directed RNA polymerase subunit RPC12/RpoP
MGPMETWAYEQQQRDGGADEDAEPYCVECGSDDLAYLEQYANGSEYKCRVCGTERIWG